MRYWGACLGFYRARPAASGGVGRRGRRVPPLAVLSAILAIEAASAAPPVDPLIATGRSPWNAEKAAHLLRRAGFGGTPEEIQRLTRMGRDRAVDSLVDYQAIPQTHAEYPASRLIDDFPRRQFGRLEPEQRMRLQRVVQQLGAGSLASLQDWWLQRMVVTPRPLEEKMTLFWHGHFTSGFREVRRPGFMYAQNALLRQHALGDFRTLLMGISRDAAMLTYLDNGKNVKAHPNENYARELMELFTMGEGHYTEQDVKEAARAFTGWTAGPDGAFVVRARQHDDGPKTFLGRTGNFDGEDIIRIILEEPATARFLAAKLWRFFVEPDPPPGIVEALADELRMTDYDLREAMRTIFRSDAFYEARFTLIKSPVELMVCAARQLEVPIEDLRLVNQSMNQMGQELFQPPNVKGWDGGRSWITTSTLFIRYNTMKALLEGTPGRGSRPRIAALMERSDRRREPPRLDGARAAGGGEAMEMPAERDGEMAMVAPAERGPLGRMAAETEGLPEQARVWLESIELPQQYSGAQTRYDPAPTVRKLRQVRAADVVDHYVNRLLGMPLPKDRREVLIEALEPDGRALDAEAPGAAPRIRAMMHLIMSMPEYQVN